MRRLAMWYWLLTFRIVDRILIRCCVHGNWGVDLINNGYNIHALINLLWRELNP